MIDTQRYQPGHARIWNGRTDPEATDQPFYWHQWVRPCHVHDVPHGRAIALVGACTDAGVVRNEGRAGASQAPDAIRTFLGPLPVASAHLLPVYDVGNVGQPDADLESTHAALQAVTEILLRQSCLPFLIGGGHDIAYPHFCAIRNVLGKQPLIGIINFDAHLDLRQATVRNSGTPFYQIAREEGDRFRYACLGVQRHSNTRFHFSRAQEVKATLIFGEDFHRAAWPQVRDTLRQFLNEVDRVYVSLDMDGFSSAYAPGVSAPSPLGFAPDIVLLALHEIVGSGKLISFDVVECNPAYDIDHQTARLAARLFAHVASLA